MADNTGLKFGLGFFVLATIILGILYLVKLSENCTDCASDEEKTKNCEICAEPEPPKDHLNDYTKFEKHDSSGNDLWAVQDTNLPEPYDESAAALCNNMKNCQGYGYRESDKKYLFKHDLNENLNENDEILFHVKNQIDSGDAELDTAHKTKLDAYVQAAASADTPNDDPDV